MQDWRNWHKKEVEMCNRRVLEMCDRRIPVQVYGCRSKGSGCECST